MSERTHRQRSDTALFALASSLWARGEDPAAEADPETVIDLLADLRHFCRARSIDYARCDRLAAGHFDAEAGDGDVSAERLARLQDNAARMFEALELCEDVLSELARTDDGTPSWSALDMARAVIDAVKGGRS